MRALALPALAAPRRVVPQRARWTSCCRAEGEDAAPQPELSSSWQVERSPQTTQELLFFFYQGELEVATQRALNNGNLALVQLLRAQQEELALQSRAPPQAVAEAELGERQMRVAMLRSQLESAVREERYAEAAGLRDALAAADYSLLSAAAAASSGGGTLVFALGSRVRHTRYGWTGAVCGCESRCSETAEWAERAGVSREQPFYVVLPDVDTVGGTEVLYCAEEVLEPVLVPAGEKPPPPPMEHALAYVAFLGADAQGGYVPTRALRERWSQPRRDVWPPSDDEEDASDQGDDLLL